jgi:hypothetical protein
MPAASRPAFERSGSPMIESRAVADITDPADANDITEPADPAEATEKAEPAEPIDPIDAKEPMEPMESAEPFEAIDRNESSDHRERLLSRASITSPARRHPSGRTAPA